MSENLLRALFLFFILLLFREDESLVNADFQLDVDKCGNSIVQAQAFIKSAQTFPNKKKYRARQRSLQVNEPDVTVYSQLGQKGEEDTIWGADGMKCKNLKFVAKSYKMFGKARHCVKLYENWDCFSKANHIYGKMAEEKHNFNKTVRSYSSCIVETKIGYIIANPDVKENLVYKKPSYLPMPTLNTCCQFLEPIKTVDLYDEWTKCIWIYFDKDCKGKFEIIRENHYHTLPANGLAYSKCEEENGYTAKESYTTIRTTTIAPTYKPLPTTKTTPSTKLMTNHAIKTKRIQSACQELDRDGRIGDHDSCHYFWDCSYHGGELIGIKKKCFGSFQWCYNRKVCGAIDNPKLPCNLVPGCKTIPFE